MKFLHVYQTKHLKKHKARLQGPTEKEKKEKEKHLPRHTTQAAKRDGKS